MQSSIRKEIERLTTNSATRRADLLQSAHRKLHMKKILSIISGILALGSAGAITTALVATLGDRGLEIVAAIIAALSGTITLVISAYFSEEDVASMFTGSSKYLALRENVYRLVIHPTITEEERFTILTELQKEYAELDESYSRFFSNYGSFTGSEAISFGTEDYQYSSMRPMPQLNIIDPKLLEAEQRELERVRNELDQMKDAT
ncbi:hypothetical protein [Gimesia aquarii]|uniref:SMODS and SLOG-associating 2TM effector domain-containing protein n=1 Tax=Gimesia aquarii TaxID=2527964 RepID=A0A517VYG6_9PLAN|nr:hypothetical protein [Gimesia aquarii]QDT98059.1 hypothetical protein V144x_35430 [Gimesia aquarii]